MNEELVFPSSGTSMPCPVCGLKAEVLQSDAARSWAEISCENCTTFAIRKDALCESSVSDLSLLSGYYRHVWHEPMTIQCDTKEIVKEHIEAIRRILTRDFQMVHLLSYYYQMMKDFKDTIQFEEFPAIAFAKDKDDLMDLVAEAIDKGYAVYDDGRIAITEQGKEWIDEETTGGEIELRDEIFISHRTTDSDVADMIKDFLVNTGIPNDKIFCSSLPGNDTSETIAPEVKSHLQKSTIIVLLLSRDYYTSPYCLNEAGIAWYLDDVLAIPIGLPEINHKNMYGFLGSDYKLRRLDDDGDISYLFDQAHERLGTEQVAHSVITRETRKLRERYEKHLSDRKAAAPSSDGEKVAALEAEIARLKKIIGDNGLDDDEEDIDYDDDIWEDGYHEVKNGNGEVLKKGEFVEGKLIKGIEYNIILRVSKGEEDNEEPVRPDELKDEKWHYSEYGQYDGIFTLMPGRQEIIETGLRFFYVVDKKVTVEGKLRKLVFTNFRSLESFLAEKEPDELDYIKTGVRKYDQTDYADVEID